MANKNTKRKLAEREKSGSHKTGKGNPVDSSKIRRASGKKPWRGCKPGGDYVKALFEQ